MNRVVVVGSSGSGKTTLAAEIADSLGAPHIELDAIYHQPNWVSLPDDSFRAAVSGAITDPRWVADGNYLPVADILWAAADAVVWLDLPRSLVMRRVVARTLGRLLSRRTLWNGNREQLRNFFSADPDHNLLLWTWTRHGPYRARYEQRTADPQWQPLTVIRLRSPSEVTDFERSIRARTPQHE